MDENNNVESPTKRSNDQEHDQDSETSGHGKDCKGQIDSKGDGQDGIKFGSAHC